MCIDVDGAFANASNIQLYRANLTSHQLFQLNESDNTYQSGHKITFNANGGELEEAIAAHAINGYNTDRGSGALIIYNVSGITVPTNTYGCESGVAQNGTVTQLRAYGSATQLTVPDGGFVVSGHSASNAADFAFPEFAQFIGYDAETDMAYVYDTYDTANGYLANHKYVSTGATYGVLPLPTREGYRFIGWYTEASGGTQISYSSVYSVSELYAHWVKEGDEVPVSTVTYNGHRYELYDLSMPWAEAKEFCEARGGYLVCVSDAAENSAVVDLITQGTKGIYWLGCTDEETEGDWKWASGESLDYSNWDQDYPEPNDGLAGNYGAIVAIDNPPNKQIGEWIDEADNFTENNFYK